MRLPALAFVALSMLALAPEPAAAGGGTRTARKPALPKMQRLAKPITFDRSKRPDVPPPPDPALGDASLPPLTAEELAADTITLDAAHFGVTQIGLRAHKPELVMGGGPPAWQHITVATDGNLAAVVRVAWLGTHGLTVQCTCAGIEAMAIGYLRYSLEDITGQSLGTMTVDLAGSSSVGFWIPGENHAPFEFVQITMQDADGAGGAALLQQCTFTRT